jgi:molybdopterin-guanine dinucleotide biosynthesis protein A
MIERAADALRTTCAAVVVVSSREDTPVGDWTVIPDLRPGVGPLAGIEAALTHAERAGLEGAFVLACDLPLVDTAVVDSVVAGLDDAPAAAPTRAGVPDFEPLCAAYRISCLRPARRLLDEGRYAARSLFEEVGGRRVESTDELKNVNTPEDLLDLERSMRS